MLHLRCQGVTAERIKEEMGDFYYLAYRNQGEFLQFEDEAGLGHAVTLKYLSLMLRKIPIEDKLWCVFLAADHSKAFGELFFEHGARHVICIDGVVSNQAQQAFTDAFYKSLFAKGKKICQAFDDAVKKLKDHPD